MRELPKIPRVEPPDNSISRVLEVIGRKIVESKFVAMLEVDNQCPGPHNPNADPNLLNVEELKLQSERIRVGRDLNAQGVMGQQHDADREQQSATLE